MEAVSSREPHMSHQRQRNAHNKTNITRPIFSSAKMVVTCANTMTISVLATAVGDDVGCVDTVGRGVALGASVGSLVGLRVGRTVGRVGGTV